MYRGLRNALAALLLAMVLLPLAFVVQGLTDPLGIVVTLVFALAHLLGTLFGIALWRAATVRRLTAALFIGVVPAMILVIAANIASISILPAWFEAVLVLGFASLGHELALSRSRYRRRTLPEAAAIPTCRTVLLADGRRRCRVSRRLQRRLAEPLVQGLVTCNPCLQV